MYIRLMISIYFAGFLLCYANRIIRMELLRLLFEAACKILLVHGMLSPPGGVL